jgi:hypothetical protein
LTQICVNTFMKYLRLVTTKVETIVKDKLPSKLGLILDGWTENSIHTLLCIIRFDSRDLRPNYARIL